MIKRLFCVLLSLALLAAAPFALAEDAAPAGEQAPLLVTVNGKEIKSDDIGYTAFLNYYTDQLVQYGIEAGTEEYALYCALYQQAAMDFAIQYAFFNEQAAALGIQPDAAAREQYEQSARDYWNSQVEAYIAEQGLSEEATEDERAAAAADAAAMLESQYGYTEESFVKETMDEYDYFSLEEPVKAELTKDLTVPEDELKAYFDDLVKEDQEAYEDDIGSFEFYTQYYGQPSYYTPKGYRGIVHILLKVDDELMAAWKDLAARLEEQKSDSNAESTGTEDAAADAEPAAEPVTQEMVDAAKQAILDSVKETVDEIKAKLDAGASFTDLINEYGTDPGMQTADKLAAGYPVHHDSILWDPAFREAAMALEKIGDVSEPVVGQSGVHILQYLRDIPEGAVEMTDEIRNELTAALLEEAKDQKLNELFVAWRDAADIRYTAEGQAILDASAAAEAELSAAVAGDETAEEAPAEEAPAE